MIVNNQDAIKVIEYVVDNRLITPDKFYNSLTAFKMKTTGIFSFMIFAGIVLLFSCKSKTA
jgi:hypothetical protein